MSTAAPLALPATTVSHDLRQIINGIEFMPPSPLESHQEIVGKTFFQMMQFNFNKRLGQVRIAPLDVIFKEGINRVQPDVLFIANEHQHIIQDWIRGVPDLVVEVVSPGTVRMDRVEKKALYEHYGVSEYWIISPAEKSIEVYTLDENGRYMPFSVGEVGETVQSKLLPGFEMEVSSIF